MNTQLLYVELKSGFSDNGPAWIGQGKFTRSRSTVYFNGLALHKAQGISSNYLEVQTGNSYWISGVKKDGTDRHQIGSGKVSIDASVVSEYLKFRGIERLPPNDYEIVNLDNVPAKKTLYDIENATS